MSHSHEHAHFHDSHDHHHDAPDITLTSAMLVFMLVGVMQVALGLVAGHVALAVEGAHNAAETPILGFNRWARRQQGKALSRLVTCWLLPLTPAMSSLPAVAAAMTFFFVEDKTGHSSIWLAVGLATVSLVVNLGYALRLHRHEESDGNVVAAKLHLFGDAVASLLVMIAYLGIGLTSGNEWLDPAAAALGVVVIMLVHIKPVADSFRSLARHRNHLHEGCANGASSR